jgi:Predicted transcriptional regulators
MAFQPGGALLDACVLAVLSRGDTYGYELTQTLQSAMDISDSTLYPVLRRLQKSGFLTTYDQPYQGRNRRYYAITDVGRKQCDEFKKDWIEYQNSMNKLLIGGNCHE